MVEMSMMMDNRLNSSNTNEKDDEVKKLQELVKKLEIQNEELRSERHVLLNKSKKTECNSAQETEKAENEINRTNVLEKEKFTSQDSGLNDSGLRLSLTFDERVLDDETWLFDSPKAKPHSEWLKKDLNDPSLGVVKKSLVKKLDEITNSPKHSPRHSLYSPASSSSGVLSPESPPLASQGEIDTRTFIRPKKKKTINYNAMNDENRNTVIQKDTGLSPLYAQAPPVPNRLARSSGSLGSLGSEDDLDRLSTTSDASGLSSNSFRIDNVDEVNALARLQEESIRNSHSQKVLPSASTPVAPPSTPSTGRFSEVRSANTSLEDLLGPGTPRKLTPPQRSGLQQPRRYSGVSVGQVGTGSRENSDVSTPPDSPYTSQQNLQNCSGRVLGSRLPGLNRRLAGSDPRLLDSDSPPLRNGSPSRAPAYNSYNPNNSEGDVYAASNRVSRIQSAQPRTSRLSAPSPVRIPSVPLSEALRSVGQMGGLQGPQSANRSSALPRPGSSKLQAPRTRTSQSPAKFSAPSDWREGCY